MIQSGKDAERFMRTGQPVVGKGWKEVDTFEDLEDADEYESDDEEIYVVMDLGQAVDGKTLLTESSYQLIGLDTPMPFMKLGNQVFQGNVSDMIGDEIIFGRIRNEDNPQAPSRPPWHSTPHRLTFRPVTLKPRSEDAVTAATKKPRKHRAAAVLSADPAADPNLDMAAEPDNIAGPSGTQDSVEPGSVFLSAQPVPVKKPPKIPIDTLEQLLAIKPEMVPSQTRYTLAAELEAQLQPQTTPEHLAELAERGWSPAEVDRLTRGRPLRGKGSRAPRARKAGKGAAGIPDELAESGRGELEGRRESREDRERNEQEHQTEQGRREGGDVSKADNDQAQEGERGAQGADEPQEDQVSTPKAEATTLRRVSRAALSRAEEPVSLNGLVLTTRMAEDRLDPRSKRGRAALAAGLPVKQSLANERRNKGSISTEMAGVTGAGPSTAESQVEEVGRSESAGASAEADGSTTSDVDMAE